MTRCKEFTSHIKRTVLGWYSQVKRSTDKLWSKVLTVQRYKLNT